MKKIVAGFASAALLTLSGAAGAAVSPPGSPRATHDAAGMHTKRLVLTEITSHSLGYGGSFAGVDKARSRETGKVIGYDTFSGHEGRRSAVVRVAFALRGGIIVIRATLTGSGDKFGGPILSGSGRFSGIHGRVTGRATDGLRTFVTLRYRL